MVMKTKEFNFKKSLILACIMLLIGLGNNKFKQFLFKETYSIPDSTGITINNPDLESQDLNVLVIEINPIINSIKNTTLYPNNNGHPKVSEYFGQDEEKALNELIEDFEYTSHQYLNINVTREYLNEYPTYKSYVTLNDGTKAHQFDEETYLAASRIEGTDRGNWYNFIHSDQFQEASSNSYTFDYDYIIEKYDLINRRNNGEFDQVWLLTIDPTLTYETIMIGNNPYWINAPGYKADCQNFQMANISISRRDANLHALAHGVEGIMTAAFHDSYYVYGDYTGLGTYKYYKTSYSSYKKDSITISSFADYKALNLWEKFSLGTYSNTANYGSIGNVHFPYNGASDYDYSNTTKVYTNWRDWLNYPNIDGNFVLDNNNAWLTNAGNNLLGSGENKDPDRLYTRFWFYLMPHITGYTEDGYLNNWWKYYHSLDFITTIKENNSTNITTKLGDFVFINCSLIYNSENTDTLSYIKEGNNIQISNENVLGFKNGYVYAKAVGKSDVTLNYDGQSLTYNVTVEDSTPEAQTFTITFDKNTALSISKTSDSCTTITDSCNIIMPSITPQEGYQVVGWSPSKTSTATIYTPNFSYSIKNDMTLYAITKKNSTPEAQTFTITFDKNTALSISKTSDSCTTITDSCNIIMPSITPQEGYQVVGWSPSKTSTATIYTPNFSYSIKNDMTLYAITKKNSDGESSGEISGIHVKTSNTATGNCVAGSELVIINSSNDIVDKWTSICSEDNLYHQIELPDDDYTLKVATTPVGYATPSPISFTITDNKIPTSLNMPYAPIQICLTKTTGNRKTDMVETKYEIYDELGKAMENFTLTDTAKCFPYTPVGTYTVKEIQNELGLTSTEDLVIKVLDTPEVQNFTIKTEIIVPKTAMNISKMIIIISISFMTIGVLMVGYFFYKKYKYNQ